MQKELSEMSLEELWQLFPIILTPPNKCWKDYYEEERRILCHLLGDVKVLKISHIGSTAILGIWAKPIVDILIEINDSENLIAVSEILSTFGYLCMQRSEKRIDFNKGYTQNGFSDKVYHIHIRMKGDHDELYFRDYLNEHPTVAKEYEQLKRSLWKKFEHDRDAYTLSKGELIMKYTCIAKLVYKDRYEL